MVLLAASICSSPDGRSLLSRHFLPLTRARAQTLLTHFSANVQAQNTLIESESCRYLYRTIGNRLLVVLVTTLRSNVIDDLVTLGLLVQVIGEVFGKRCVLADRASVFERSFDLLAAMDEVICHGGYRSGADALAVREARRMHSDEEVKHLAERARKEHEAIEEGRRKARLLSARQAEAVERSTSNGEVHLICDDAPTERTIGGVGMKLSAPVVGNGVDE